MKIYRALTIFNGKILLVREADGEWDLLGDSESGEEKIDEAEGFLKLRESLEKDFAGARFLMDQAEKASYRVSHDDHEYIVCNIGFSEHMSIAPRVVRPGLQSKWFRKDEAEKEKLTFIATNALIRFANHLK